RLSSSARAIAGASSATTARATATNPACLIRVSFTAWSDGARGGAFMTAGAANLSWTKVLTASLERGDLGIATRVALRLDQLVGQGDRPAELDALGGKRLARRLAVFMCLGCLGLCLGSSRLQPGDARAG